MPPCASATRSQPPGGLPGARRTPPQPEPAAGGRRARPGPEELAIRREQLRTTVADIQTRLSPFEREVLAAHLAGGSYRQIARQLGCTPKAVENALVRLRRKLRGSHPTH